MQWGITLDLASIHEWGLNVQQGVVFAYLYNCPSWCTSAEDDSDFFNISNGKLATELSMISVKRDTMLRHIMHLVEAGLLERRTIGRNQYIKLTDKAKAWNRTRDKNPASDEQREINPAATGKKSREQRDNFPKNQYYKQSGNKHQDKGREKKIRSKKIPDRYLQDCIDAYHECFPRPNHPAVIAWSDTQKRARNLITVYKNYEFTHEEGFWLAYFEEAAADPFHVGKKPFADGGVYFATIEYLTRPDRVAAIYEAGVARDGVAS